MKSKSAAILKHIIDSLFVVVLAAIIVLVAWTVAQSYCEKFIIWIVQFEFWILAFGIIAISVVLGWIFPKEVIASVRSLKLWPRHWGLAVRGFLGSVITFGLAWCTELLEIESKWLLVLLLGIIFVESLVLFLGWRVAQINLYLRESSRSRARDEHTDDEPIHTLEENLFPEHEITSRRILDRLNLGKDTGGRGPNVAVIGPYGSGKTSLCNLIKDISKKESNSRSNIPLVFCRFEAWEFLTADAAVRGLLDQIVSKVEGLVDCSGLGSLPEEYLDTLRACPNGWFGMIAAMLKKRRNPEEVIRTVQDVLLRIGKRVIVFVDDFDRLESKSKETQQAIAAALNQLQNLTNVQYVLCVGRMREGAGADLLKLTRFQELMPEVRGEEVIEKIRVLRDEAIRGEQTMYYPWDLKKEGNDDPLKYYIHREALKTTLVSKLVNMIETPRQLKAVDCETREKWNDGLKGEISWYDLLLMGALKVGEPGVFEWIMREPEVFLDEEVHITEPTDVEKEEARSTIEEKLRELLKIKTKARLKLVQQVLISLFPKFGMWWAELAEWMPRGEPQVWEQSISLKPGYGSSYFSRYFSGCISSTEVPDQPTLQYIRDISNSSFQQKEFEQRYLDSNQKLKNNLNRFVQFSGLLTQELAQEVCDCMLDWMCDREHWNVWEQEDEYVSAGMINVKSIMYNAGQFEFAQARRKARRSSEQATNSKEWYKDRLENLLSKDVIVAQEFADVVVKDLLGDRETKEIVGAICTRNFLSKQKGFWEQAKGKTYYLGWILDALKYNDDYESIRDQVTESILEIAEADKSGESAGSVVISLVHYKYPAGRPDLVEGYEFSVNKLENQGTFNMDKLLPLIAGWEGRKYEDPVSAKAYEFLVKEYAEELKGLDEVDKA